jgi:hypothetical protein
MSIADKSLNDLTGEAMALKGADKADKLGDIRLALESKTSEEIEHDIKAITDINRLYLLMAAGVHGHNYFVLTSRIQIIKEKVE